MNHENMIVESPKDLNLTLNELHRAIAESGVSIDEVLRAEDAPFACGGCRGCGCRGCRGCGCAGCRGCGCRGCGCRGCGCRGCGCEGCH